MPNDFFEQVQKVGPPFSFRPNIAESAIPQGTIYNEVPIATLFGLLEDVSVGTTFISRRWTDDRRELLRRINRARSSQDFDWCEIQDNMTVVGETETSHWLFLLDWQDSCGMVGRFPFKGTLQSFARQFKSWAENAVNAELVDLSKGLDNELGDDLFLFLGKEIFESPGNCRVFMSSQCIRSGRARAAVCQSKNP